jgi:hypothetical protein
MTSSLGLAGVAAGRNSDAARLFEIRRDEAVEGLVNSSDLRGHVGSPPAGSSRRADYAQLALADPASWTTPQVSHPPHT